MQKYEADILSLPDWETYFFEVVGNRSVSKEERQRIRKNYKRLYNRLYRSKQKRKDVKVVVTLPKQLYLDLLREQEKYGVKHVPTLIKRVLYHFITEEYPTWDTSELHEIAQLIRKAGNNINQVVHKIHRTAKYKSMAGDIEGAEVYHLMKNEYYNILAEVLRLEEIVCDLMKRKHDLQVLEEPTPEAEPITLSELLQKEFSGDEVRIRYAMDYIEKMKNFS